MSWEQLITLEGWYWNCWNSPSPGWTGSSAAENDPFSVLSKVGTEQEKRSWWCSTEVRGALLIHSVWSSFALPFSSHGDTRSSFINLFHGIWSFLPREGELVFSLYAEKADVEEVKGFALDHRARALQACYKISPSHQENMWGFPTALTLAFKHNQIIF